MTASVRCFVFDFDGTLVESNHIKRSAFYEVTAAIPGAEAVLDEIFAEPEPGDRYEIFDALSRKTGGDAGSLADAYGVITGGHISGLLRATPIGAFLEDLRSRGCALFIASATPEAVLTDMLCKTPLAAQFDGIFGGPRDKATILGDISRHRGWSPRQVVMVGDGIPDCRAAEEFGCRFIGVGGTAAAFGGPVDLMVENINAFTRPGRAAHILEALR